MMRVLYNLLLLAGFAICRPSTNDQPSFEWIENRSFDNVPILKISYPDDGGDDFALLSPFNPIPVGPTERSEDVDNCIFDGYLQNEKDVYVTLTGCPMSDSFEIQFNSRHLKGTMFKSVNGQVEVLDFDRGSLIQTEDDVEPESKVPNQLVDDKMLEPLNPSGYIGSIKLFYDDNWFEKFDSDSENAARRVMAHAQNVWRWPSLTTKVIFNVHPDIVHLKGRWMAEKDRPLLAEHNDPSVNTNIYLCVRFPTTAANYAFGKGKTSGACSKKLSEHSVIMEYEKSDIIVGRSLAHEIGHNFGINHDFTEKGETDPRFDSDGKSCLEVGGIMDYSKKVENDKSRWSKCSVEDFTKQMNANKTCLKQIDPANPPTSPAPPEVTNNACDMTKGFPDLNGVHTLWLNGVESEVMCISGFCSTREQDENNGCQRICGRPSCNDAKDPGTCDLTKQLQDFTGEGRYKVDDNKVKVSCVLGKCRPVVDGGYSDACFEICKKSSCVDASVVPR